MIRQHILNILIISIITLAHISWAKPTPAEDLCLLSSKYEITDNSEKDKELLATDQLLKFAANGLQKLTLKYSHGGKSISEQLLKNNDILNSKSIKILQFKQNLTKFEEKYKACDGIDELFALAETYANTTSFYYELDASALDEDDKFVVDLLRKYGSEALDREFEKFFDVFVADFNRKFETLKPEINKEESKVSQKLLEWFVNFKTLITYDDKIYAFERFFEFF